MKITELILELTQILQQHGDLDVETTDSSQRREPIRPPRLAYRAKLKGKEWMPRFFDPYRYGKDAEERKGDPVCRL
jgi:hypothetical protein